MSKQKVKKSIFKRWWFWVAAVIVFFIIVGSLSDGSSGNSSTASSTTKVSDSHKTKHSSKTKTKRSEKSTPKQKSNLVPAVVLGNIDGDTIRAKVNSKDETVRMLLIDTPKLVDSEAPVEPYSHDAADYAAKVLPTGRHIYLQKGAKRDKDNNLLAFVYITPKDMYNEYIVKKGLARVVNASANTTAHLSTLQKNEDYAQSHKLGIWSISGYVKSSGYSKSISCDYASKHNYSTRTCNIAKTTPKPSSSATVKKTTSSSSVHSTVSNQTASSSNSSSTPSRSSTVKTATSHTVTPRSTHVAPKTTHSSSTTARTSPSHSTTTHQQSNLSCQGKIKGNANSKIYHLPGDAYYNRTTANIVWFCTEAQAQKAGYRASER